MKYGEFESMIIPFINVRGGDVIYPRESLSVAIENWIQDIYNEYKWNWLITTVKLNEVDWIDGNGYFSYDMGPLKSVNALDIYDIDWNYLGEFTEVKKLSDLNEASFLIHGNIIIVAERVIASVSYSKDHTWRLFNTDTSIELPLPHKFIPALYYLVLSQIDIIEVTQAESQTYSNYGKYTNKIKTLKDNDISTSFMMEWGNRP